MTDGSARCELQVRPAGGLEIGAGDEAAGVGAEQQGGADHFLRPAGAVHGVGAVLDLLPLGDVLTAPAVALGGDQAGGEGVQQDASAGVFAGEIDDQVVLGGFERGVDAEGVVGAGFVDAAEGEDAAPALLGHRGDGGLEQLDRGGEVDGDLAVEFGLGDVGQGLALLDRGGDDQDVDVAEGGAGVGDGAAGFALGGEVGFDGGAAAAEGGDGGAGFGRGVGAADRGV